MQQTKIKTTLTVGSKPNAIVEIERELKEKTIEADRLSNEINKLSYDLTNDLMKLYEETKSSYSYQDYLQSEINKRDEIINGIYCSRAWKIIHAYRYVKYRSLSKFQIIINILKKVKRKLRYTFEVSRFPVKAEDNQFKLKLSINTFVKQLNWSIQSRFIKSKSTLYNVKLKNELKQNRPKVIHAIPNTFIGGSTQLIVDLVEYLGHKYDMEIITFALPKEGSHKGLAIHDFSYVQSEKEIAEFLKTKNANLVHVHYWGLGDDPWYKKVFDAVKLYPSCKLIENINTPIKAYMDSHINHYVYVSKYAQQMYNSWPENSRVIYPGSNFSHFKPTAQQKNANAVGMVYRLEPDKLREDAIQVFIELVKRRPQTKVYIVGMGTFFESYLNQVYTANVRDNFIFTGYVPYKDLPSVYDKFSVFVAPVWKESFGQVTPFAMNKELGVAGYKIGALPEILDGSETLADTQSDVVDKIIELLDNPDYLREKCHFNHKRAQEHFSVETMIAEYDKLYSEILNLKE